MSFLSIQFEGSIRILENFSTQCDKTIFHRFIQQLDQFLGNTNQTIKFLNKYQSNIKLKNSRDIKKCLTRLYKRIETTLNDCYEPVHEYFEFTPHFLELSHWDTLLYLLRVKFKVIYYYYLWL